MTISSKKNKRRRMSPELKVARVILFVLIAWTMIIYFSSCKAKQPIVTSSTALVEKIIEKDKLTPVAVPGEKTNIRAQFECDSLNRVLLMNFNELKSKNMNSSFSFANGQLDYSAQTQPDTVFIPSTDYWYYINRHIKQTVTITKPVYVYINKFGFLDWIGLLFCIALAGYLAFKLVTKTPFISNIKKLLNIN